MNGVATKIAQEVAMLFQHRNFDAGARQEIPQHHAGRPAPGDAAACGKFLRRHDLALATAGWLIKKGKDWESAELDFREM
jgi:hypothetical protein